MQVVKISKWGNSQGVRISKDILRQIGIDDTEDSRVSMNVEDGKLVIQKASSASKIMQRFQNYDYNQYLNDSDRVDGLGQPVGRELW